MKRYSLLVITCLMLIIAMNCESNESTLNNDTKKKISFDIEKIGNEEVNKTSKKRVSIDYEFCIPAKNSHVTEIKKIDSTVKVHKDSSGRIGCTKEEYLCIGNTRQKHYKDVLYKLAKLNYIKRIDRCFWE